MGEGAVRLAKWWVWCFAPAQPHTHTPPQHQPLMGEVVIAPGRRLADGNGLPFSSFIFFVYLPFPAFCPFFLLLRWHFHSRCKLGFRSGHCNGGHHAHSEEQRGST